MNGYPKIIIALLLLPLLGGCSKENKVRESTDIKSAEIVAVNYPLYFFTKTLAADLATVTLFVPQDLDPAEWNPGVDDALRLQQADLIILNGAGYSKWLDKVSLTPSKLIDTSASFQSKLIPLEHQVTHSHGPEADHSHRGYAFTTWMDIEFAKSQAQSISHALAKHWPDDADTIRARENTLLEKLTALDDAYKETLAGLTDRTIIYSHPVYQYFERRYKLPGHSLHWEPDQAPSERQWSELERLVGKGNEILFIWEDFPSEATQERMNTMRIQTTVIRPAANRSDDDWLTEQLANIQRLKICCQER